MDPHQGPRKLMHPSAESCQEQGKTFGQHLGRTQLLQAQQFAVDSLAHKLVLGWSFQSWQHASAMVCWLF
jgi:hypothetical protein